MAIKKVIHPVLIGPSEYKDRLEQELIENEANSKGKEEPSMNQLNTVNSNNLNGRYHESFSNTTVQKGSALERVISFEDDLISMKRIAKIHEGVYDYRIEEVTVRENVETQYGLKDQYVVSFSLYSEITDQITKLLLPYNISSNNQSALMMFLGAFKGIFKGQRITMRHLVGLIGQARIYHVVSEAGNVFEKIEILTVENPNT